jgi:hypothetical protein
MKSLLRAAKEALLFPAILSWPLLLAIVAVMLSDICPLPYQTWIWKGGWIMITGLSLSLIVLEGVRAGLAVYSHIRTHMVNVGVLNA